MSYRCQVKYSVFGKPKEREFGTWTEAEPFVKNLEDNCKVVFLVKPNPACTRCRGSGEVVDWVPRPFGPGSVGMPSLCDCVDEQLPVDAADPKYEIRLDGTDYAKQFVDELAAIHDPGGDWVVDEWDTLQGGHYYEFKRNGVLMARVHDEDLALHLAQYVGFPLPDKEESEQ